MVDKKQVMGAGRSCTVEGCGKPHEGLGYCKGHRRKFRQYGDALYVRPSNKCSVVDCSKPYEGKGYCKQHRRKFLRWGDASYIYAPKKNECQVIDCAGAYEGNGYCKKHNRHFKRYGNPLEYRNTKHGMLNNAAYRCWVKMKNRCLNPQNDGYEHYGGRGISVYLPWVDDFKAFMEHIGERPSPKHEIDRIDVNGNYEPGNVRWANRTEQMRNTREQLRPDVGVSIFKGGYWRARIHVGNKEKHLGLFKLKDEAIAARKAAELRYWLENSMN